MSLSYSDLSPNEIKDLLRKWRETNERRSGDVVQMWDSLSLKGEERSKIAAVLGNEFHVVVEQVFYAAVDCHREAEARDCFMLLLEEFNYTTRVSRAESALMEANEKYEQALDDLEDILKIDETNAPARKRRVAIYKAQGLIPEAIKELVEYLKKFMADVEGWQELSELYLRVQEYSRAAFCAEELLLHQPHNHLMHQRLADIRYTMGGVENMELAKTYYSHALKLNPDNMRALLGLFLATNNLLTQYKSSGNSAKRKEVLKLCQWTQNEVAKRQRRAASPQLHDMMLTLSIAE